MIHLYHARQQDRTGGLFGAAFFILKPGNVLRLEPGDPGVNRRTGDLQHAAHTDLVPALIVQFDHVRPGVVAIGMRLCFLGTLRRGAIPEED
jgi:hypothetical protein